MTFLLRACSWAFFLRFVHGFHDLRAYYSGLSQHRCLNLQRNIVPQIPAGSQPVVDTLTGHEMMSSGTIMFGNFPVSKPFGMLGCTDTQTQIRTGLPDYAIKRDGPIRFRNMVKGEGGQYA